MSFAQPRVRANLVARGLGDDASGPAGSTEVAAVKRGERRASQPPGQGTGLGFATRGERAIEMALVSAFHVPGRFAVTKKD